MRTLAEIYAEYGDLWALSPEHFGRLMEVREVEPEPYAATLIDGPTLHGCPIVEIEECMGPAEPEAAYKPRIPAVKGAVAVLPLHGIITQRDGWYGTSADAFGRVFDSVMQDDRVGGVLVDAATPGGVVFGTPELADRIFNARGTKPIIGVVNSMAASAGFWLISQCDQVVITPGGQMGSHGVYSLHLDHSGMMEQMGIKATFVKSGEHKTDGNMFEPLTDEAREDMQRTVGGYFDMFTDALARGYGVTSSVVKSEFGQGQMFNAAESVKLGIANRVATLDQVLGTMAKNTKGSTKIEQPEGTPKLDDVRRRLRIQEG